MLRHAEPVAQLNGPPTDAGPSAIADPGAGHGAELDRARVKSRATGTGCRQSPCRCRPARTLFGGPIGAECTARGATRLGSRRTARKSRSGWAACWFTSPPIPQKREKVLPGSPEGRALAQNPATWGEIQMRGNDTPRLGHYGRDRLIFRWPVQNLPHLCGEFRLADGFLQEFDAFFNASLVHHGVA